MESEEILATAPVNQSPRQSATKYFRCLLPKRNLQAHTIYHVVVLSPIFSVD
jgi:hypothetical protein